MTSAQVVETSVTNNSSFQNYTHPDDHTIPTTDTPGFKPFTVFLSKLHLHTRLLGKVDCSSKLFYFKVSLQSDYFNQYKKYNLKLPAQNGTTVFHFALISFAIFRFIPLSTLRLRFPWRGCRHFIEGLNLTPSSARCLGHIVKSRPSEWPNKPVRAKMSSFSDATSVWDTFISLKFPTCDYFRSDKI